MQALALLRRGADPSVRDVHGRTAEQVAGSYLWASIQSALAGQVASSSSSTSRSTDAMHTDAM
jgi:hypothetical protein